VAGAGFGVVVSLVLWPLGSWLLNPVVESAATGPLGWLLASRGTSRRLGRPLVVQGQTSKLPTAKAMDALRLASEAARRAPAVPTPPSSPGPSAVRTTAVRTSTRGQGSPAGGEAS
ncbi:MAG TPA: hypothetical protein VK425_01540, partial [Acidimicrobiales bacterium]|nr:hypothetical protein [Acidimicrobiales bacterium]